MRSNRSEGEDPSAHERLAEKASTDVGLSIILHEEEEEGKVAAEKKKQMPAHPILCQLECTLSGLPP
jgi:hypothetical protein